MTEPVVLDSNIVIEILNGQLNPADIFQSRTIFISAVSVMEVYALAGMFIEEQNQLDTMIPLINIIPVTTAIARRAGILARTRKGHKADLMIAATALELNFDIMTKNVRDFRNILGIRTIQP